MRQQDSLLSLVRRRAFILLRSAAIVLFVLGLGGFAIARLSDQLSIIFLLDDSRSITNEQRSRAAEIIEAIRGRLRQGRSLEGAGDNAWLARFGANTEMEPLAPGAPLPDEHGEVDGSATDIGGALQFSLAQMTGKTPRIVLLTDGNENRGSAEQAAAVARSLGARIFPAPLSTRIVSGPGTARGEVSVEDIRAPERVRQGEPHEVTVMVQSSTETRARVTLFREGLPVATREGTLAPGENAVQFSAVFPQRGLQAWDALVQTPSDASPENNHFRRFVEVTGPPQVLYVARPGHESPALRAALAAQGITAVELGPTGLPGTLAGYLPYDALIFDDVPGYGISNEKMETIAHYVQDTGGGLLMIGGPSSFGSGGYYKTPIERILPVDMDVKSQVQLPRVALVLVVDKSGSMSSPVPTGETKLDVVKSAALSSIELLNPFDRVGILAFDADWEWTVPITDAGEVQQIATDLASLQPGGGTVMYPALEEAYRAISSSTAPLRHIIVLTDGLTNPGNFEKLVRRMAREKISVSTVAVGEDADTALLRNIARWGGGRTYATDDPRDVPQIFMTETTLVTRGLLVEKSFFPRAVSAGESIRGISLEGMPSLSGFVLTYMKPGAEMVLSALYDAPLLAEWRCGLGRTAAFTSDFRGRWSRAWLGWDQFPRFVAQQVRWIERPSGGEFLHPRIDVSRGKASIRVDAYDEVGAFVNGLDLGGIVLGPEGERTEIKVVQVGPGLYEGGFDAGREGDYAVTLSARAGDVNLAPLTLAVSVPYSDEYRMLSVDTGLLGRLAAATGGRVITSAEDDASIAELLRRELGHVSGESSAWRYLLLAGLVLFFLDIVVRRLVLPEGTRARLAALLRPSRREPGLSYDELTGLVEKAHEEERKKLRHRISGIVREEKIDPELAAYLYIARLRSRKAEKEKQ
jgi:Mg-chelatase subunit ChlD